MFKLIRAILVKLIFFASVTSHIIWLGYHESKDVHKKKEVNKLINELPSFYGLKHAIFSEDGKGFYSPINALLKVPYFGVLNQSAAAFENIVAIDKEILRLTLFTLVASVILEYFVACLALLSVIKCQFECMSLFVVAICTFLVVTKSSLKIMQSSWIHNIELLKPILLNLQTIPYNNGIPN